MPSHGRAQLARRPCVPWPVADGGLLMMANSLLWRPFPVLLLTVRQFLGGRAVLVVTVLSLVPALFAALYLLDTTWITPREFLARVIFLELVAPTLLPISVLILATGALGYELEDRTLPYLTLKPVSRLRIVVEKLAGVLAVAIPTILAGLLVAFGLVSLAEDPFVDLAANIGVDQSLRPVLWASLVAGAAGVVAVSAIFLTISLYIPRALLAGIIYSFVWESLLGRFLPGIRIVSIRHYVQSIFVGLLDDSRIQIDNAFSPTSSLITLGAACLVAIALATWRLRRMNLE